MMMTDDLCTEEEFCRPLTESDGDQGGRAEEEEEELLQGFD